MNTEKFIFQGFERLLQNRDFSQITIADILSECGISRSTFYRHFTDKYELLSWYYAQHVNQLIDQYAPGQYRELLIDIFEYMAENRRYYQRILEVTGQNSFWDFLKGYSDAYYLKRLKSVREPTPTELWQIDFISMGDVHSVRRWVREGFRQTPAELADFILSMVPDSFKNLL